MRQIKFRGRLEETDKIIFFELGEVELVADGLFSKRFEDYVVDIEQFIATDKNGYDVYEGDVLVDRDGKRIKAALRPNFTSIAVLEETND